MKTVNFKDQDPLKVIPHGDRLLIELMEVDEKTDSGLLIARIDDRNKEHEIGWTAGVVINVGNGHRMDVPDRYVAIATVAPRNEAGEIEPQKINPMLAFMDPDVNTGIVRVPSTVPMPFERGDVVMLAKHAGSDIQLQGKAYKIITQSHVIAHFVGRKIAVDVEELPPMQLATVPCTTTSAELEPFALEG